MAKTFRAWEPEQRWLLPPAIEEFVPAGHLAHFVRELVREELDLSGIVEVYDDERGQPPYHPVMMTALLLYAYCQGVYASRRIAQACEQRLDFMAVTALAQPDFRTISDFRKRHLAALSGLFTQVLKLCAQAGLVKLGHVALDGTKIKANASKHKAMSYGRMKRPAAAADAADDGVLGAEQRGDELPAWVREKQERLAKIRAAKAALEAEAAQARAARDDDRPPPDAPPPTPPDKAQRNFTDPDSRIMKGPDGFVQAYNAQAAVDAESQVVVAQHVTPQATDAAQFEPLVVQIKANTGRQAAEVSADAGYCSEHNLRVAQQRHIRAYIATGRQHHGQASATNARRGRTSGLVAAMRQRLRRGGWRSRYRLRKGTVEPVFGIMKHVRGFRQFLLRGATKV